MVSASSPTSGRWRPSDRWEHDISENTAEGDIIFGYQVLATATEVLIRA
jgi:hypothetical protein